MLDARFVDGDTVRIVEQIDSVAEDDFHVERGKFRGQALTLLAGKASTRTV